jgi:HEPN domain-containing protein
MRLDPEKEYQRWITQARMDLDDAEYSARGGRNNLACFLSQQAAEKAVKAYLYRVGHQVVWGHSVAELIHDALESEPGFGTLKEKGSFLDRYYIPTRYPNGLPGGIPSESFSEKDASEAIAAAREIIAFVSRLSEASS